MERQRVQGSHREKNVQRENHAQRIKPGKRLCISKGPNTEMAVTKNILCISKDSIVFNVKGQ